MKHKKYDFELPHEVREKITHLYHGLKKPIHYTPFLRDGEK
jgi:hypothetical protein